MDEIIINGVPPYDGRYELSFDREFTTREWGWIKRLSGYLPMALEDDALSDPELACVLAVIMMRRAGRIEAKEVPAVFDRLVDAPFGSGIVIETSGPEPEAEDDAGPPAGSSNGSERSSGESGTKSSETSPPTPPASGIPASAISTSAPPMSAT